MAEANREWKKWPKLKLTDIMITSYGTKRQMENVESEKNTKRINKSRYSIDHNHLVYVYHLLHSHNLRYSHYARCCKGDEEEEEKKNIDCFVHTEHWTSNTKAYRLKLVEMALTRWMIAVVFHSLLLALHYIGKPFTIFPENIVCQSAVDDLLRSSFHVESYPTVCISMCFPFRFSYVSHG